MISEVESFERVGDKGCKRLETAPTLVEFVRHVNVDRLLRDTDYNRFEALAYDAAPIVRALFCRDLAGLSWNGLYEVLSTEDRAVRLGFAPTNFGPYNTAPTRQTLTTAWDMELSDAAKRALLSLSERLVAAAYENDDALYLRPPRHADETESNLRERPSGNSRMNRFEPDTHLQPQRRSRHHRVDVPQRQALSRY